MFRIKTLTMAVTSVLLAAGCSSMQPSGKTSVLEIKPVQQVTHGQAGPEAHYQLGRYYQGQMRYELALEAYRQALALQPQDVRTLTALGVTHASLGQYDESLSALRAAAALAPNEALTQNNLGYIHWLRGERAQSVAAYRQALRIEPMNTRARDNIRLVMGEAANLQVAEAADTQARQEKSASPTIEIRNADTTPVRMTQVSPQVYALSLGSATEAQPQPSPSQPDLSQPVVVVAMMRPTEAAGTTFTEDMPSGQMLAAGKGGRVAISSATPAGVKETANPRNAPSVTEESLNASPLLAQITSSSLRRDGRSGEVKASPSQLRDAHRPVDSLAAIDAGAPGPLQDSAQPVALSAQLSGAAASATETTASLQAVQPSMQGESTAKAFSGETRLSVQYPSGSALPAGQAMPDVQMPSARPAPALTQLAESASAGAGPITVQVGPPPSVEVLNGNGIQGIATAVSRMIANRGYPIAGVGNYTGWAQPRTRIEYAPGMAQEARKLRMLLPAAALTENKRLAGATMVRLVLGRDIHAPATAVKPSRLVESMQIAVANGNGVKGMARQFAGLLSQYGFATISAHDLRPFDKHRTRVEYRRGFAEEAVRLGRLLPVRVVYVETHTLQAGVRLVIGHDIKHVLSARNPAKRQGMQLVSTGRQDKV